MSLQQTLVLIKPDGVKKKIIGEIIKRIENTGLTIKAMKMIWPDKDFAIKHYPLDEEWAKATFEKTKKVSEENKKPMKFKNHLDFAKTLQKYLADFITESPIIAMVIEGPHAIEVVRKIIGSTEPRQALPGTIRSDFSSIESYEIADKEQRAVRNLIHASDSEKNAKREIELWFSKEEIHDYYSK